MLLLDEGPGEGKGDVACYCLRHAVQEHERGASTLSEHAYLPTSHSMGKRRLTLAENNLILVDARIDNGEEALAERSLERREGPVDKQASRHQS